MMKLTVFTPTFNRAYLLPQLYTSLLNQTNKDFVWLIVDDGSTDNTKELIDVWVNESLLNIQYVFQENQGMHGAHNTAYDNCMTEFNVCIDSDDYMPDDAVEKILHNLNNLDNKFAGVLGLDANKSDLRIIGTKIPEYLDEVKLDELYSKYNVSGDKKVVLKTSLAKKYPKYPIFKGEKFVPLDYLYLMINQKYPFKPINEVFCIVEYQEDGSTKNILKQYRRHPNGFAFSRVSRINYGKTFKEKFKNAIHLVSSSIFASNYNWLTKTNNNLLVFMAMPFGILLNIYIRLKTK